MVVRRAWALFALIVALGPALAFADPAATVESALQNILSLPRAGQSGYATVWDGDKYVQCSKIGAGGLRCEAAGTRMQPSLERVLTPDRQARLAALGWKIDPHFGNYAQSFSARSTPHQVADLILRTLAEGYGADVSQLEVRTAWLTTEPCPPRNGWTQNLAGMINDAPEMASTAIYACEFTPEPYAAAPAGGAEALVERYGARVRAELQRLRVNIKDDKLFIVFQTGIGYIQCAPETEPDAIYCEAQSADSWAALSSILTADRIARLHAAGYADPGRAPNYAKEYRLDRYDDAAIAREILTLLHDVYGYDGAEPLKYEAETGAER
jgi:type III secretion system-like peptide-binding chaperone